MVIVDVVVVVAEEGKGNGLEIGHRERDREGGILSLTIDHLHCTINALPFE